MKQKLNIAFLCSWYPSRVHPGGGIFIQQHAEAVSTEHHVFAIHIISDENNKENIEIDASIINGVSTYIAYLKPTKNPLLKLYRYISAYRKIKTLLPKIDLFHVNVTFPHGLFALFEKLKNKTPYIISEHWSGYHFPQNKSISFFKKIALQKITGKASWICPVSENLKKSMIEYNLNGNYHCVPNYVNTHLFKPTEKKSTFFTITHISNMGNECKNVIGILKVIAKLEKKIPNLKFNLIGSNTEQHLNEIKTLNIKNIQVINHLPQTEMVTYLQQSNVFVLFSNYENLPCVILESFACGVPVVSSNVGGISEYFPDDFGILVPPKDEVALEKAILAMFEKTEQTNKEKLHQYAEENFGSNAVGKEFSTIYYKTLA